MEKQKLNELGLVDLLRPLAIFWFSRLFGNLLKDYQSYLDTKNNDIKNAIGKILKNLQNNNSFMAKIQDLMDSGGLNTGTVMQILQLPQIKAELLKYKNDKNIDFNVLQKELQNSLTKGMESAKQIEAAKQIQTKLR